MKGLFVDTAGWVGAADRDDPKCDAICEARDRWLESGGLLITTDAVCSETLTVMRIRLGLRAAESWWRQVEQSRRIRFENIDPDRAERARAMFFRYKDKEYSFVDCTSFVVMKELRLEKALTLDAHFTQAGFTVLPT